ncbi:MAG TPA: hypothetical protein VMM16_07910 [Verrucomicrobiae bacterium]|nr:hypothetical protein [Verrucomicrobiae bacterium]
MNGTILKPAARRTLFYVGTIVVAVVAWRMRLWLTSGEVGPPGGIYSFGDTDTAQSKGFDIATTMIGLLTTLGTALLGAIGFLLNGSSQMQLRPRHLVAVFLSAACVGVSLYYGYAGYLSMLFMADAGKFDPYMKSFQAADHAQFYSLLIAVFFFADFVVHDLRSENGGEHAPQTSDA